MDRRDVQPSKALPAIFVTESGMSMERRDVQPLNADQPISITESGMSMERRDLQPLNAKGLMLTIPFLITIFVSSGIDPLYL